MLEIGYDVLDRLVNLPGKIVDEVKWELVDDGLRIRVVDPSHVAMADIFLDEGAFEEYEPDVEKIGINVNKFNKFLGVVDKDKTIKLELGDTIVLKSGNIKQKMPSLDLESMTEPSLPSLDLPSSIKMKGEKLKRGAKASALVSDQIEMKVDNDGFMMSSEKDENSIKVNLDKEELEKHECGDIVSSIFALDYFSDMVSAFGKNEMVYLRLGIDYPFKLEFSWADELGKTVYLLAPRIEDA